MSPSAHSVSPLPCVVMHESLPSGRVAGTLEVTTRGIDVVYEGGSLSFAIRGLDIRLGGANDSLIFLTHPDLPGWSLFTRDRSITERLSSVADAELSSRLADVSIQRRSKRRRAIYALGIVAGLIWGLFALRTPVVNLTAALIPKP